MAEMGQLKKDFGNGERGQNFVHKRNADTFFRQSLSKKQKSCSLQVFVAKLCNLQCSVNIQIIMFCLS